MAFRINRGDATAAVDHIGPFSRIRVPVQFTQRPGSEHHQNSGELLRHRKFGDGSLLSPAAVILMDRLSPQRKTEGWQFLAAERGRSGSRCRLFSDRKA